MRALSRRTQVLLGVAVLVVVAVVVVLVVRATAGPSSPGDVVFGAGGVRVEVGASQFCDVQVTDCGSDPEAAGVLRVPPNTPLTVTVPEEVASTPWQVAFTFRDAAGAVQQGRSPVFAPGTTPNVHARPAGRGGSARECRGPAVRCAHQPGTERPRVRDADHVGTEHRRPMT